MPYVTEENKMKMEHKTISLADQIFERLEHDILVGEYGKGDQGCQGHVSG